MGGEIATSVTNAYVVDLNEDLLLQDVQLYDNRKRRESDEITKIHYNGCVYIDIMILYTQDIHPSGIHTMLFSERCSYGRNLLR